MVQKNYTEKCTAEKYRKMYKKIYWKKEDTEKLTRKMELSIAFRNYRYKFLKLLTTFWKLSLVFGKISDNF